MKVQVITGLHGFRGARFFQGRSVRPSLFAMQAHGKAWNRAASPPRGAGRKDAYGALRVSRNFPADFAVYPYNMCIPQISLAESGRIQYNV